MPLSYAYYDPYLSALVTPEREARALAEVTDIRADFTSSWLERLVRLRAYAITCQESQRAADDLFSIKLAQYSREFREVLPLATAAADAASTTQGGAASPFSIELIRG